MRAAMLTSARYDAHPTQTDAVILVCVWASQETQRTIVNQALRDALDAAGKLGVELIPQT